MVIFIVVVVGLVGHHGDAMLGRRLEGTDARPLVHVVAWMEGGGGWMAGRTFLLFVQNFSTAPHASDHTASQRPHRITTTTSQQQQPHHSTASAQHLATA